MSFSSPRYNGKNPRVAFGLSTSSPRVSNEFLTGPSLDHKKDMELGSVNNKEITARMRPSNAPSTTAGSASAQDVARLEYQLAAAVSGAAELRVANQQLATRVIMNEGNVRLLKDEIEQARLDAAAEHNRAEKLLAQLEITQTRILDTNTPVRIAKDISAIAKTKEAAVKAKAVTTSLRTTLKGAVQAMREWQQNELVNLHELQITAPSWVHQKLRSSSSSSSTALKPSLNESFADPERSFDASSASFMRNQADLKAKLASAQAELVAERTARKSLTAKVEELEATLNKKIEHTLLDTTLEKLALVQQQYSESQAAAAVSHSALKKAEVQLRAARSEMASLQEEVQTLRNQRNNNSSDETNTAATKANGSNKNDQKEQYLASERALTELRADYEKRLKEQANDAKIAAERIAKEITTLQTAVDTMKKERDNSALTLRQVVSVFDEDRKLLMAQITALQSIDDSSSTSASSNEKENTGVSSSSTPSVRSAVVAIETSGLRTEIARLEGELKEIRANTAAKETLAQKESLDHALQWQQQLLQYQAKVGELEKQLAGRSEEEEELRGRLAAAHEGSKGSKKKIETLTNKVQELQEIINSAGKEDENDPIKQVKEATKDEIGTLKEMVKNKDRIIDQLRNQLAPLQRKEFRDSDLSAQLKEAQAVISVLKSTVKEVADEKVATVAKLSAKDSDLLALASQIPSHVSSVTKELQTQLGHARDEAISAKSEYHVLQAAHKELTAKFTHLETENAKLRKVAGTLQRFADIALSADAQSLNTRQPVYGGTTTDHHGHHSSATTPMHLSPSSAFKQIAENNVTSNPNFHAHPLPEPLARVLHSHRRSGSVPPSSKVSFDSTSGISTVSDDYPTPPRPSSSFAVSANGISPRTRNRPMSSSAAKARRELSVGALPPSTIKKRMVARTSRAELIKSGLIHPSQRKVPEREFNIDSLPYPSLPETLLHYSEIGHVHPMIPGSEEAMEAKAENIVLHVAPAPHLHPTVAGVPLSDLRTATPPKLTMPKQSPVRPTRLNSALTPAHSKDDAKVLKSGMKRGNGTTNTGTVGTTAATPFRSTVMDSTVTTSSTSTNNNNASQNSALSGTVRKPKRIVARWGFAMYLLRTVQEENKIVSLRHGFDQLRINTLRSRMEERERALAQVNRYLEEANIPAPDLPERFEQLRTEVENLRQALLEQQRTMEHARSEASALRAQLNASAHAREELLSKLQTERENLSHAREETRRLVDALGENETERSRFEQEINPLRRTAERVPGLEADKARLEQELRTTKQEILRSQELLSQLRTERELILGIAELLTPPRQSELIGNPNSVSSSSSETLQALHRADLPADLAFLREQAVSIAAQLRTKADSIKALESTVNAANEALMIAQKQYENSQSELAKIRPDYERVRMLADKVPELQYQVQNLTREMTEARSARDIAESVKESVESKALQAIERTSRLQLELDQSVARAASLASAKVTLEAELLRLQVASKQAELQRNSSTGSLSSGSLFPPSTPRSSLLPSTPLRSTASTNINGNGLGSVIPTSARRASGGGFATSTLDYSAAAATTQPKRTAPPPPPSSGTQ